MGRSKSTKVFWECGGKWGGGDWISKVLLNKQFIVIFRWKGNIMRTSLFLITSFLLLLGCSSEPVFPIEPHLEFIEISPLTVTEFQDSIFVTMSFTDGDGDLGDEVGSEVQSIKVRDLRILPDGTMLPDDVGTFRYSLPDLRTNARNPSIQGKIYLSLLPTVIFPRSEQTQTTKFSITITDQAGHESNEIVTDEILIVR